MNGRDHDHRLCGRRSAERDHRIRTDPRPRLLDPPDDRLGQQQHHHQQQQHHHHHHQQQQQQQHRQRDQRPLDQQRWRHRQRVQQTVLSASQPQPQPQPQTLPTGGSRTAPQTIVVPDDRALSAAIAADGYQLGVTVGHGSYSKVRVAVRLTSDAHHVQRFACKVIDKRRGTDDGVSTYVRKFLPRELDVLRAVRHPNVVRTHRIYVAPSSVLVFMDYCEMGDLLSHLQNARSVPQWQAHMFFRQICDAVDYLHRNGISHRDIKCENVLLEDARHVKLTDFGFARMCATDERGRPVMSQTYCGSSLYAAPEVLQGIPYDPKASDVWALGVVLYVMLADCMPYPQANRQQIVANQIAKKFNKPKKSVSREALKLVAIILEPDVMKRATVYQVRRHHWVSQPNPYHYAMTH